MVVELCFDCGGVVWCRCVGLVGIVIDWFG